MKLGKVQELLNVSATQVARLIDQNKIVRYKKKSDTNSYEYDDESVYAYKQYQKEKAKLEQRYNHIKYVIKRDKSIVPFDKDKISNALSKAFNDVYKDSPATEDKIEHITNLTVNKLIRTEHEKYDITEIQNAVEQSLVDAEEYEVATAYTEYRLNHDIARRQQTSVEYQINRLFNKDDDVVNENANKDADVYTTQRDLTAGAVDKAIGLKKLPKDIADAHMQGLLHWHDLDYSPATNMHNCFRRDTKFITRHGIKSFYDYNAGDIIEVLTPSERYERAVVKRYKLDYLNQITFTNGKETAIVYATENHRWLLQNNKETINLTVGDKLRKFRGVQWTVKSITANMGRTHVWCLEVEKEHAFILEHNIPTGNCGLVNLKDMLENGFRIGNADIEPPKSLKTAVILAGDILSNISTSQYGGTSYNRIDEVLAPYAKKSYEKYKQQAQEFGIDDVDKYAKSLTRKEIKDSMKTLEYEINSTSTSMGQTPFSTLGFGLGTSWFEREIQIAILEQRMKGLGKDCRTAIFPKLLFTIKPGINKNKEDPNYDIKQLALKCVVKRMSPEILNYDNVVDITGSFKCAMGCRSFLNGLTKEDLKAQGKDEDYSSGRLNLGVVSLNLPRVALDSHGDKNKFWKLLDERIDLVKKALLFRVETVKQALPKYNPTGFMYGGYGRLPEDGNVDELFKNNRASVSFGYVGLYEMTACFYGDWQQDHSYNQEARDFAYNVLKHMNHKAKEWKQEYGYAFSCYGTPGEALNSRFEEQDHKLYPNVPYVTDHDFYTNSFHYFVERKPTPFEKLAFEAPFQALSTGGFISYVELPIMKDNLEAVEAVWDYSYDCGIGYCEINTAIDHCLECGFEGEYDADEKGYHCPNCGNSNPETSDVTRRICGYLGNPMKRPPKHGRQSEIIHRVKHISGSLGQLSNGDELQSEDADDLKVRK